MTDRIDPKVAVDPAIYAAALADVNRIRSAAGLEPLTELPPGEQMSVSSCPIGRALQDAGVVRVSGGSLRAQLAIPVAFAALMTNGRAEVEFKTRCRISSASST